jgi:hypothetical protein
MPDIVATFKSDFSESRKWTIWDTGRDPNAPLTIFDGYLEPEQVTDSLTIYSEDGVYGIVAYKRSDSAVTGEVSVTADSEVSIS